MARFLTVRVIGLSLGYLRPAFIIIIIPTTYGMQNLFLNRY
jgi:hypothetical protein